MGDAAGLGVVVGGGLWGGWGLLGGPAGASPLFGGVAYAGVPEGGEVVGDVVDGVGWADFPVGGQRWLYVWNVEEPVWLAIIISTEVLVKHGIA